MIKRNELEELPLSSMAVGDQTRFDHKLCGDKRARLYVLRKNEHVWLAYCHNCGDAGLFHKYHYSTHHDDDIVTIAARLAAALKVENYDSLPKMGTVYEEDTLEMPVGCHESTYWDQWACTRLHLHGTSVADVTSPPFDWRFDVNRNQIITPIRTPITGALAGYQARNAPGIVPKCITTYHPAYKGVPLFYWVKSRRVWVICEDPLSAMKLYSQGHVNACALLGTHLNDYAIRLLNDLFGYTDPSGKVLVWMDGDEAGRKATGKIINRLASLLDLRTQLVAVDEPLEPSKTENVSGALSKWI